MKAGLSRRAAAFFADVFVGVFPALVLMFLPGVFVPLDRYAGRMGVVAAPLTLGALAYVFVGCALLPNSYGRWAFGIRVVDAATGGRPRVGPAFVRALTLGLWPLEALVAAFSRGGRRLGDRWAGTTVVRYEPAATAWKRAASSLGVVAVALALPVMIPAITARMDISRAASAYAREALNAVPLGGPGEVRIVGGSGSVTLRLADDRHVRVHLVRDGERWSALRSEPIGAEAMGGGFSIQSDSVRMEGR